jgi:methanogenic corrinoid protein MtbC1
MVSAGLQAEGFRVNYLGAELPVAEILAMAQREHADLVALSCCVAEREGISEAVRTLADAGFPVMVGGSGIGRAEALELGATRYGGSIADAQTFARELVRTKPR